MIKRIPSILTAALLVASTLTACGGKQSVKSKAEPRKQHMFVHGDPRQVIAGSTPERTSFLTLDSLATVTDYELASIYRVSQYSPVQKSPTRQELEQQNSASEGGDGPYEPWVFQFQDRGNGLYSYDLENRALGGGNNYELEFVAQDGRLELRRVFGADVRPIHYSMKDDGEGFSFLFESDHPTFGLIIMAVYFVKVERVLPPLDLADSKYNFLLGPGIKTSWHGDITAQVCGQPGTLGNQTVLTGLVPWIRDGHIGSRKIVITESASYPPFSDMNNHCIKVLDDFLFEKVENAATLGLAIPVMDATRQRIVAADIFISSRGHQKVKREHEILATITHEFGHFLGLDHEFERDPVTGAYVNPSIMGYGDETTVTSFDVGSIEALYGPY